MTKSKFAGVAKTRLDQKANSTTGAQAQPAPSLGQTITQAELDAITPDQSAPYTTVGCKVTREAGHYYSIRAKQTRIPVADCIRRALLETYGMPPDEQA